MKKFIYFICGFLTLSTFSCSKENSQILLKNHELGLETREGPFTIYKGCWEEWGRASKECDGWGLCRYDGAWFWQDDFDSVCDNISSGTGGSSGTVTQVTSGLYELTIALNNSNSNEANAISARSTLYIDQDIIKTASTNQYNINQLKIPAGAYNFNNNVGNNGGYKIAVQVQ
ncbi:MAG TPA: hypothetical protein PK076_07710 [Saprospiraceae bacterium]|nr:hypothetical protein [Saprospiraceae bacterium]HQW55997.1 hypothetical protein [Saprospiraceae bacterium]